MSRIKSPIAWDVFKHPSKHIGRTTVKTAASFAKSRGYRVIPVFKRD